MATKNITDPKDLMGGMLTFKVKLVFNGRVYGGLPKNPNTIRKFIEARSNQGKLPEEFTPEQKEQVALEIEAAVDANGESEASMTVFARDERGLYVENRQLKALLKECASILGKSWDVAAAKNKVAERVFVEEPKVYLVRAADGVTVVTKADGEHCAAIHVQTSQGPRSALKMSEYVEGAQLEFTVVALNEPLVTKTDKHKLHPTAYVEALLKYGERIGIGKDRSQSQGTYTLVSVTQV